jgi:uncharacterized protein YkwD
MNRSIRRLPVIAALVVAIAVLASGCTRNMDAWDAAVLVNQTRNDKGIHSLDIDEVLVAKAQAWAEHMAATGTIKHSTLAQGAGDNWTVLGENVGWARSIDEMHSLFMDSASHRTTLLDRRYDRFGVGVAVVNGRYYTAMVFAG